MTMLLLLSISPFLNRSRLWTVVLFFKIVALFDFFVIKKQETILTLAALLYCCCYWNESWLGSDVHCAGPSPSLYTEMCVMFMRAGADGEREPLPYLYRRHLVSLDPNGAYIFFPVSGITPGLRLTRFDRRTATVDYRLLTLPSPLP